MAPVARRARTFLIWAHSLPSPRPPLQNHDSPAPQPPLPLSFSPEPRQPPWFPTPPAWVGLLPPPCFCACCSFCKERFSCSSAGGCLLALRPQYGWLSQRGLFRPPQLGPPPPTFTRLPPGDLESPYLGSVKVFVVLQSYAVPCSSWRYFFFSKQSWTDA